MMHDVNSYRSLQQHAWKRCEFCDKIFDTRYANIRHNANHIIIPLIKLTLYQCDECLFYFSSLAELNTHVTTRNHKTSQFPDKASQPKRSIGYEEILQSIVEKQALVKCHDTLNEVLSPGYKKISSGVAKSALASRPDELNSKRNIPDKEMTIYEISSDSDGESPDIPEKRHNGLEKSQTSQEKRLSDPEKRLSVPEKRQSSSEIKQSVPEKRQSSPERRQKSPKLLEEDRDSSPSPSQISEPSSPIEPLSRRIIFEDDFDDDDLFEAEEILPDKPYHPPKQNSYIIGNNMSNDNTRQTNSLIVGSEVSNLLKALNGTMDIMKNGEAECYTKSVHYDELILPELQDCRYCGRCFSNRYELIKHETVHMRAKPARPTLCCVCERYLAGNHWTLRRHMDKYHPQSDRKLQTRQCRVCHLNYHNYRRHIKYYHRRKCEACKQCFIKQDYQMHKCVEISKICNGFGIEDTLTADSYTVVKMCEMCLAFAKNRQNVHYEIIGEHSEVGSRQQCYSCLGMHFEVSLVRRKVKFRTEYIKKKPLSNQERLKKIQNRLKMVNKMNKC